jgi:MFS-type transporter involved in bile tolerance (Atg22 family)
VALRLLAIMQTDGRLIESFRLSATKTAGIFTTPFSFFLEDGPTEHGRTALALLDQESEDHDEPCRKNLVSSWRTAARPGVDAGRGRQRRNSSCESGTVCQSVAGGRGSNRVPGPVLFFTSGVFLKPMAVDMQWQRSTVSFALSLATFLSALAMPILGRMMDRWGITGEVLHVDGGMNVGKW